ncbi:MAG: S9 family peptidase [Anaerolineae bacterium]|nr:S9 family peptidase [Anaerolineae bacterium]
MTHRPLTPDDLYHIVSLSEPRFSPDGRRIAYVRTEMERESNSYRSAIWIVDASGGRPRRFTAGDRRDAAPRWSPDGRWLAFTSTRGGEKQKPQLYLMPTDGGEAQRLVELDNGVAAPAWSPDGRHLAFTARANREEMEAEDRPEPDVTPEPGERERQAAEKKKKEEAKSDPRVIKRFGYRAETSYFDDRTAQIYLVAIDPETGQANAKPRRLTSDERNYADLHWLPDGSGLLATVDRLPGEDDLFYFSDVVRVPIDGGGAKVLTSLATADRSPRPSPDGQWIAYVSAPVDEISWANVEVNVIPASGGGEPRTLTATLDAHAQDPQWLPVPGQQRDNSAAISFLVARHGRIDLLRTSLSGETIEPLLAGDREILAYDPSPDGRQVAFVAATDRAPWDLYLADLASGEERRLTRVNDEWLAERTLGNVQEFEVTSADGTPIQAWMIQPPGWDPATQYPLALSIHGGPHVMWSRHEPTMWHEWQVLAGRGYLVLAMNPRGSDGYGRAFRGAARKQWGEADLPDLLAGVDEVIARGYVDPDRLAVTGGSYGGFMTVWIVGHSDRFRAAVAQRGVYDLIGFYGTSDVPRLVEWEFEQVPWEDPDLLWKYSPLAYVEEMHTPLLLIHSDSDFRAPIPAAEGLFVALRRLKRDVQLVRYPREGHELSRSGEPKHRVDRLERIAGWFDQHVNHQPYRKESA